jgi:hypothetical protein
MATEAGKTTQPKEKRKARVTASSTRSQPKYIGAAIFLIVLGCVVAWIAANVSDASYTPAVGVSVFALLYVLAQGVERAVEVIVAVVDALTGENAFAETHKRKALAELRSAGASSSDTDALAAKEKVEKARADLTVFTQALSFSISIVAVAYAHYGILANIGVAGVDKPVDRFVTALAIMGGSKGLHDLISKVQNSKENDEERK